MSYYGYPATAAVSVYDPVAAGRLATFEAAPRGLTGPEWTGMTGQESAAASEKLRHQAAAALLACYRWLESAVPLAPETGELATALTTAVQQYQAQQYGTCLTHVAGVVQAARQIRVARPTLPPL